MWYKIMGVTDVSEEGAAWICRVMELVRLNSSFIPLSSIFIFTEGLNAIWDGVHDIETN
jgi:hypothetical protein